MGSHCGNEIAASGKVGFGRPQASRHSRPAVERANLTGLVSLFVVFLLGNHR